MHSCGREPNLGLKASHLISSRLITLEMLLQYITVVDFFVTLRSQTVEVQQVRLFSAGDVLFQDIHEIEAMGRLVVLATWPGLLAGSLWIHFIDNAAAQESLFCRSSDLAKDCTSAHDFLVCQRCGHDWL